MKKQTGKVQRLLLALLFLALPAEAQTIEQMVNAVSDSALFSTIAGLQGFGSRYYSYGNQDQVSKWLRGQYVALGMADVAFDSFVYNNTSLLNVVATLPGTRFPDKEIIVGGHIDSRSSPVSNAPGADDDASGTAAALEIARVLISSGYRPSATIRFIGFEAEEAGLVGSQHYASAAKAADRNIILMFNFDMIGYNTAANSKRYFYITNYVSESEIADIVSTAAKTYTTLTPLVTTAYQGSVDAYSFASRGYTSVNCIEYVFNPYYHSTGDVVGVLDSSYVRDITRTGLATILHVDGTLTSVESPAGQLPLATRLEQNYPNPFNPRTSVKWQVASGADVKIAVYDLLGREVAVLVDERKQPGVYEVQFDGSGLASGMYVYRLSAGSFVQARRMLLIR